jgi:hypothetical protein
MRTVASEARDDHGLTPQNLPKYQGGPNHIRTTRLWQIAAILKAGVSFPLAGARASTASPG